jgi:hypothetical protein
MALTQTDFIKRARGVHGERYDYNQAVYVGANLNLTIICREHGQFEQTPSNHFAGKGCLACAGLKPYTLKSFTVKSCSIHGEKYNYSRVKFVNVLTKIIIGCRIHGDFEQTPSKHMGGSGCTRCSIDANANKQRYTIQNFISAAQAAHKDRYDYSLVRYVRTHTKVKITCREHGPFDQTPAAHQRGSGCPVCAGVQMDTTRFVEQARTLHGDHFNYERTIYARSTEKVTVTCNEHGDIAVIPSVHLRKNGRGGCKACRAKQLHKRFARTTDKFIAEAHAIHGCRYDYSQTVYVNKETNVRIGCPEHGNFSQRAGVHVLGGECPQCSFVTRGDKIRLTQDEFIARARAIHSSRYDYSQTIYTGADAYVTIKCLEHDAFEQNANSHMQGSGCPSCAEHGFNPDQPAVLYVLYIDGPAGAFTGYGVTRDLNTRLRAHRKNLALAGFKILRQHTISIDLGRDALALESRIQHEFELVDQGIDGFRTEATHARHFSDVIKMLSHARIMTGSKPR